MIAERVFPMPMSFTGQHMKNDEWYVFTVVYDTELPGYLLKRKRPVFFGTRQECLEFIRDNINKDW